MKFLCVVYGSDRYSYEDGAVSYKHFLVTHDGKFTEYVSNWKNNLAEGKISFFSIMEYEIVLDNTPSVNLVRSHVETNPLAQRVEINKKAATKKVMTGKPIQWPSWSELVSNGQVHTSSPVLGGGTVIYGTSPTEQLSIPDDLEELF